MKCLVQQKLNRKRSLRKLTTAEETLITTASLFRVQINKKQFCYVIDFKLRKFPGFFICLRSLEKFQERSISGFPKTTVLCSQKLVSRITGNSEKFV